jgi:hypothetical protein
MPTHVKECMIYNSTRGAHHTSCWVDQRGPLKCTSTGRAWSAGEYYILPAPSWHVICMSQITCWSQIAGLASIQSKDHKLG